MNGAEGQNRTGDTVIFSHVLYQLSYLGTVGRSDRSRTRNGITQVPANASMRVPQANAKMQALNASICQLVNRSIYETPPSSFSRSGS